MPTATLVVDARTYQFKGGGDAQGVTDRLAAVTAWDPLAGAASPVLVHRTAVGLCVVDGHQRVALARRLGVPVLHAVILEAAVAVAQARRIGARLNLQHGTGSAIDVAKILRADPLTPDERATMPADALAGDTLRTGEALVALGPEAFARVVNGQVHPQPKKNAVYGALVGRLLVGDAEQVDALARLAESQPESEYHAEQFVRAILADGFERGVQSGLFGDTVVATSLAGPIAQVLTAVRRVLLNEQAALGGAVRHEGRLVAKGNALNQPANRAGVAEAAALDHWLAVYGHTVGPVRDELKRVAGEVAAGRRTVAQAVDAVLAVLVVINAERPTPAPRPVAAPGRSPLAARVAKAVAQHARTPFGPRGQQWIQDQQARLAQEATC